MSNITLYRHPLSGHSHKAELFLSILGIEAQMVNVDLANAEHKKPAFLRKNAFGQLPVLEDGELVLSDSNAILTYLAGKYDDQHQWLPNDPAQAAEVQRFLSTAAGPLAYGPCAARLVTVFGAQLDHDQAISTAHALLKVFEQHLQNRDWLATTHATIADLANYTYIAHAPEGNVSLEDYPNVRAWLKRIESLEGFVPMQASVAGLAA